MIEAIAVSKQFGEIKAVESVTLTIKPANVFGLLGTNGAGKSTFLRMLSGIIKPDRGEIRIEGEGIFENIKKKGDLFYISDDQYFLPNATAGEMGKYYQSIYKHFDLPRFDGILNNFSLDSRRKINTFSKGMKRQLSIIAGICANTKYLLCDEAFDGLDPVVRQGIKSLIADGMATRELTPVIASHNLRELEDICDCIGLLHQGGVLLERDLTDLKCDIHKIQCVFKEDINKKDFHSLEVLNFDKRGSLVTLTIRGGKTEIIDKVEALKPLFYEVLPLSLEEIFISETEVAGYDIKKLIL